MAAPALSGSDESRAGQGPAWRVEGEEEGQARSGTG
jgi:hypothetical protein